MVRCRSVTFGSRKGTAQLGRVTAEQSSAVPSNGEVIRSFVPRWYGMVLLGLVWLQYRIAIVFSNGNARSGFVTVRSSLALYCKGSVKHSHVKFYKAKVKQGPLQHGSAMAW